MAEVRKQLSEYQFAVISQIEQELAVLNQEVEKVKQKQQMTYGLILDFHGVLGQQVAIDPKTKELVIKDSNIQETPLPVE